MSSALVLRNKTWYIRWRDQGRDRWRSTCLRLSDDPKGLLARQVQRDFDSSRARQTAGIEDEAVGIEAGFGRYLATIRQNTAKWLSNQRSRAARLAAWLTARHIETWDQITAELLDDFIAERGAEVSAKTVIFDLGMIKAAARILNRSRTIKPIRVETWPSVKRALASRPDRIGAYTPAEIEAILRHLDTPRRQKTRMAVMLLAYLGCRWSELQRLVVSDVRLSPPGVRIENRKSGRNTTEQHRWVEIHHRILPVILDAISGKNLADRVFSLPCQEEALRTVQFACEKLGIQYRRVHGFRHAWITSLLGAGVPLAVVMRMAGHRNIATTQRYLHIGDDNPGWIERALPATTSVTTLPQKVAENYEKQAV